MKHCVMSNTEKLQFDKIPSFLGLPISDLEDLMPGQVAIAGYFCDNLDQPSAGQRYLARQLRYVSRSENRPINATDLGDVNVFPLEPEKHFPAVISQCEAVLETGACMVLVGGDSSGLNALGAAVQNIVNTDVPIVSLSQGNNLNLSKTQKIILSVDLKELAGKWVSKPRRLNGLSPSDIISQINNISSKIIAVAIFGLAPELDFRGSTETLVALNILEAVVERLEKGAH